MLSAIFVSALTIAAAAAGADAHATGATGLQFAGEVSAVAAHSLYTEDGDGGLEQHEFGRQLTGWRKWSTNWRAKRRARNSGSRRRHSGGKSYVKVYSGGYRSGKKMGKAPVEEEEVRLYGA
jgi:hypothetical protein